MPPPEPPPDAPPDGLVPPPPLEPPELKPPALDEPPEPVLPPVRADEPSEPEVPPDEMEASGELDPPLELVPPEPEDPPEALVPPEPAPPEPGEPPWLDVPPEPAAPPGPEVPPLLDPPLPVFPPLGPAHAIEKIAMASGAVKRRSLRELPVFIETYLCVPRFSGKTTKGVSRFPVVAHSECTLAKPERSSEVALRLVDSDELGSSLDDGYRRYCRYVAAVILRLDGRSNEVDDLVQDVFVEAARGIGRLRQPGAIKGWLATIAVRTVRRHLRLHRVRRLFGFDNDISGVVSSTSPLRRVGFIVSTPPFRRSMMAA